MSTGGDILARLERIVELAVALLDEHGDLIVQLAKELGLEAQVKDAAQAMSDGIREVDSLLSGLREELVHVQALHGMLSMLEPLMDGLNRLVAAAESEASGSGVEELIASVLEPVGSAAKLGGGLLERGAGVLAQVPKVERIDGLMLDLSSLSSALDTNIKGALS